LALLVAAQACGGGAAAACTQQLGLTSGMHYWVQQREATSSCSQVPGGAIGDGDTALTVAARRATRQKCARNWRPWTRQCPKARQLSSRVPTRGAREVVRALLEAGADATLAAADGRMALTEAAQKGHGKMAQLLRGAGCWPR
jgi:hypothetical protein